MAEKLFKNEPPAPPAQSAAWNASDSLGIKIEKAFIRIFQGVILWGWSWIAELAVHIFDASMKILKPGMMRMFTPIIDEVLKVPNLPPAMKTMLENVKKETGEAGVIGVGVVAIAAGYQFLGAVLAPLLNLTTQGVNQFVPNTLPDARSAAMAYIRGLYDENTYNGIMDNLGWGDRDKVINKSLAENHASMGELIEFLRRGLINDAEFILGVRRLGVPSFYDEMYKSLKYFTPPVNDLIRFMVREAFDENAVSKYGYDADYPAAIDTYLPLVGLTPEWGQKYWRSHWTLPSPTQAYEMLHRGIITEQELSDLLKTSDYPEFWRSKLMAVSYNNLTRVDVRRLLQAGLIDRDKALRSYKAMGYTPEDAEILTNYAEQGIAQDEKDLTRSDVVGMYIDGLMDQGATSAALVKMGYDSQEASTILKQADFDIAKNARVDAVNYAKEQYIAGKIDINGVRSELTNAGLPIKGIDRYILNWERAKKAEIKGLSQADARRLFKKDIITEAQFRDALKALQYSNDVIELFVKEVNQEKDEASV